MNFDVGGSGNTYGGQSGGSCATWRCRKASSSAIVLTEAVRDSRQPICKCLTASQHRRWSQRACRSLCNQCSWRNLCLRVTGVDHRFHRSAPTNLHHATLIVERAEHGPPNHGCAARLNNQIAPNRAMKIKTSVGWNREVMLNCARRMHHRVFAQPDRALNPVCNLTHAQPHCALCSQLQPTGPRDLEGRSSKGLN